MIGLDDYSTSIAAQHGLLPNEQHHQASETIHSAEQCHVDGLHIGQVEDASSHLGLFSHEAGLDTAEALQRTLLSHTTSLTDGMRQASSLSSTSSSTRGGFPDKVDPKQQICFDFTKGACSRGETCKYSHDIALIVSINSQERGICFDHLKGQCNRGLLCRFSHDLSSIAMQQKQFGTKTARRNAPICYDFVKGQCLRGISCRYSHDLSSIIHGNKTETEVCHDFLRGRCHRGGLCRYSHAPPSKASQIPGGLAAQLAATLLQQAAVTQQPVETANLQLLQQLVAQVGAQQAAVALATAAQQSHVPLANAVGLNAVDWNARAQAVQQQRYQQLMGAMQRLSVAQEQQLHENERARAAAKLQDGVLQPSTSAGDDFRIQAAFLSSNGVLMPTARNAPNQHGVLPDDGKVQGPPQPVQAENVEPTMQPWDAMAPPPKDAASPPSGGAAVYPQSTDMLYRFKEIWER